METKWIALAVSITVAVTIIAGVLIPVLDDASDDQKTLINNSLGRYSKIVDSDINEFSMSLSWPDLSTGKAYVSINGGDPVETSFSSSRVPLVMTEYGAFEAYSVNSRGLLRVSTSATTSYITDAPINIEVASSVVTITTGENDSIVTVATFNVGNWLFYPDLDGDYTAVNTTTDADTTIYINSIDDLFFATNINTDSLGFVSGHGSSCTFYNVEGTPTYSMSLANYSQYDDFTDVISTTIADYDISTDAGVNADNSAFSPFIVMVPRVIEGHTDLNNSVLSLYGAIPVMVIVALLAAVVAAIYKSRV